MSIHTTKVLVIIILFLLLAILVQRWPIKNKQHKTQNMEGFEMMAVYAPLHPPKTVPTSIGDMDDMTGLSGLTLLPKGSPWMMMDGTNSTGNTSNKSTDKEAVSAPLYVTDLLSAETHVPFRDQNFQILTALAPYRRSFAIFSKAARQSNVLPLDGYLENARTARQTVGYVTPAERLMFERICYVHLGGSMKDVLQRFEFIPLKNWDAAFEPSTRIDVFACLLPHRHQGRISTLLKKNAGGLILYEYAQTVEQRDALKFFTPYGVYTAYDFRKQFPEHATFFKVMDLLSFDLLLCTNVATFDPAVHGPFVDSLLWKDISAEATYHATAFVPVHPYSLSKLEQKLQKTSSSAKGMPSAWPPDTGEPVHEPNSKDKTNSSIDPALVSNQQVHLRPSLPMDVSELVSHPTIASLRTIQVRVPLAYPNQSPEIDGVPVKKGDLIELTKQRRPQENGIYVIQSIQNAASSKLEKEAASKELHPKESFISNLTLSSMYTIVVPRHVQEKKQDAANTAPSGNSQDAYLVLRQTSDPSIYLTEPWFQAGTRVYIENLDEQAEILQIDRTKTPPQVFYKVPTQVGIQLGAEEGSCITNPSIKTKWACESRVDPVTREPKKQLDVWDRPCRTDNECPFFQANKNYLNVRGGCHNGYCEMPIGVRRLSFRKYVLNDQSFPYCHQCKDPRDPNCCEAQKDRTAYPHLKSPDVAFPMDHFERPPPPLHLFMKNISHTSKTQILYQNEQQHYWKIRDRPFQCLLFYRCSQRRCADPYRNIQSKHCVGCRNEQSIRD